MHKTFLRIESATIFLLLLILYHNFELSWTTFALFILVPDVFMIGYLKGPRVGAFVYNLGHNYAVAVILAVASMATDSLFLITLAAVWAMHISADRALGFGLKKEKGFKYTHLN